MNSKWILRINKTTCCSLQSSLIFPLYLYCSDWTISESKAVSTSLRCWLLCNWYLSTWNWRANISFLRLLNNHQMAYPELQYVTGILPCFILSGFGLFISVNIIFKTIHHLYLETGFSLTTWGKCHWELIFRTM